MITCNGKLPVMILIPVMMPVKSEGMAEKISQEGINANAYNHAMSCCLFDEIFITTQILVQHCATLNH